MPLPLLRGPPTREKHSALGARGRPYRDLTKRTTPAGLTTTAGSLMSGAGHPVPFGQPHPQTPLFLLERDQVNVSRSRRAGRAASVGTAWNSNTSATACCVTDA